MARKIVSLLVAVLSSGCLASTDLETMVRPEWTPHSFERILVYHNSTQLDDRKAVEGRFAAADSTFLPAHQIFFPGDTYSDDEVIRILEENSVDAVLVVNPSGQGASTSVLPGQTTTTCTVMVDGECQQTSTTGGPTTISKPYANFSAQLYEWESGQVVWTASAESGGNAFADQDNIQDSLVREITGEFLQQGILEGSDSK